MAPGPDAGGWTVGSILRSATEYLASHGVESPRGDAERVLAHVLGVGRMDVYLEFERPVTDGERGRLRELVRRRGAREPLQHVLGRTHFRGLDIACDRRALVPRRDTETLVERAIYLARARLASSSGPVAVADVGTGTGCVALALARELGDRARIVASDVSGEALLLARENALALGLEGRVEFVEGDLMAAFPPGGTFDLICANLPYVPSGDIPGLAPEVRDHDPLVALAGGADGLDVIRRFAPELPGGLAPGGRALLEVGDGQAAGVRSILEAEGLADVACLRDLAGAERVVECRRPG